MTQNLRYGLFGIAFLTLIWMMTQISKIKDENQKLEKQLISMQANATHYATLKKRWGKKDEKKNLLRKLERIKAFDKRFKKGGNEVIVYKQLDAKLLDRVSYTIFSSDVFIVDAAMDKKGETVNLKVEMK